MKFLPLPSVEAINSRVKYDPLTGIFTWRKPPFNRPHFVGREAGTRKPRGTYINFKDFGNLAAHRLAWKIMYGDIPAGLVMDHIDRNPHNNAIANLRLATHEQNTQNTGLRVTNTSGFRGVCYIKTLDYWVAQYADKPKKYFRTCAEAVAAHEKMVEKYFGEFKPREFVDEPDLDAAPPACHNGAFTGCNP